MWKLDTDLVIGTVCISLIFLEDFGSFFEWYVYRTRIFLIKWLQCEKARHWPSYCQIGTVSICVKLCSSCQETFTKFPDCDLFFWHFKDPITTCQQCYDDKKSNKVKKPSSLFFCKDQERSAVHTMLNFRFCFIHESSRKVGEKWPKNERKLANKLPIKMADKWPESSQK